MERIEFFQNLGFSDYEAKTLSSLIKLKSASPKEISLNSSVPQNKLYSILNKFEKLGILAVIPSETKKYELINLKQFIKDKIKEKEEKLKLLKKDSGKMQELKERGNQAVFSLIKGQRAIMNKIAETNNQVEKEILGVQRNWKVWGEGLREMQNAIKRGVDVKFIGVINDENIERVKEWKKVGCKIKAFNKKFGDYPLRFSIFDGKYARMTIGKPEIQNPENYITIWTDSKALIIMLRNQFNEMWKQSIPIKKYSR
ncbi:MAG: helix-turn-helix domain-containing protein [Candidatus Nanoarchaeia archaeon]|nr:helix-turn-helix domain-containing protein [Candidatus Nanoarchaeia archaeon]MDD5740605.1 helix-turn-helix domain-containing protein [Candidatus Nanoarchaeia archaeon]